MTHLQSAPCMHFTIPGPVMNALDGALMNPIEIGTRAGIQVSQGRDIGNSHVGRCRQWLSMIPRQEFSTALSL